MKPVPPGVKLKSGLGLSAGFACALLAAPPNRDPLPDEPAGAAKGFDAGVVELPVGPKPNADFPVFVGFAGCAAVIVALLLVLNALDELGCEGVKPNGDGEDDEPEGAAAGGAVKPNGLFGAAVVVVVEPDCAGASVLAEGVGFENPKLNLGAVVEVPVVEAGAVLPAFDGVANNPPAAGVPEFAGASGLANENVALFEEPLGALVVAGALFVAGAKLPSLLNKGLPEAPDEAG